MSGSTNNVTIFQFFLGNDCDVNTIIIEGQSTAMRAIPFDNWFPGHWDWYIRQKVLSSAMISPVILFIPLVIIICP